MPIFQILLLVGYLRLAPRVAAWFAAGGSGMAPTGEVATQPDRPPIPTTEEVLP